MNPQAKHRLQSAIVCSALSFTLASSALHGQATPLDAANMPKIGTVDERFQSYNIEMVEVIGGRFWKPYSSAPAIKTAPSLDGPVGMDPNLYEQRKPINLSNPRLIKLAAGLAPAYVRVSGTWANTTFFADSATAPTTPPTGFNGVLTRPQWKGVVDFSNAVNAKIVTSVSTSPGARDANGNWTPDQAAALFAYTRAIGGHIAATEFMNEPTFAAMGGAPKRYDAATFGRDLSVFKPWLRSVSPDTILLGPGSVGEGGSLGAAIPGMLASSDLLKATGDVFDDFSYHFYGAASQRCAVMGEASQTSYGKALSATWLEKTVQMENFYAALRDQFAPGKPLWLTETADAACGGNPWAQTFTDTFRYLHQLGALAKLNVQVVMHNTLAASDYGLIDESTLAPRPNYWAALLWQKLMGTVVLQADPTPVPDRYVYAHCLRGQPGGVALMVLNTGEAPQEISITLRSERFTLSASSLSASQVQLNGARLSVDAAGNLPKLIGASQPAGVVHIAPQSVAFFAIPTANNAGCR